MCLKRVLADMQDALLFGPESIGFDGLQLLNLRVEEFDAEMSRLCERLQVAQQAASSQAIKTLFRPLRDEETARWTESITQLVIVNGL